MSDTRFDHSDVDDLSAGCLGDDFLTHVYGREHRVFRGNAEKISGLLDWNDLNTILAYHQPEPPRMYLLNRSGPEPAQSYTQPYTSQGGNVRPRLHAAGLHAALSAGSTLVLNRVDELHPPVEALAAGLERLLRTRIQVNAYAAWTTATTDGLGIHRDDHDVIVYQLQGSKRWRIYGPTEQWWLPLDRTAEHILNRSNGGKDSTAPTATPTTPIDDVVLTPGDVLYLPRGFWHAVTVEQGPPSLHLTCGPSVTTGADLGTWILDRLRQREAMRADVPRFHSADEQSAYLDRWRQEILAELSAPDLIQRFFAARDTAAPGRLDLSLPYVQGIPADPALLVRLLTPLATLSSADGNTAVLTAQDREITFTEPGAAAALALLIARQSITTGELAAVASLSVAQITWLLSDLVAHGVVAVTGTPPSDDAWWAPTAASPSARVPVVRADGTLKKGIDPTATRSSRGQGPGSKGAFWAKALQRWT